MDDEIIVLSKGQLDTLLNQKFELMEQSILEHFDTRLKVLNEKFNPDRDEVLNLNDVQRMTGYSIGSLYRLTSSRDIPHYKAGNRLRFKRSEVEQWMCQERIPTNNEIEAKAATYVAVNKRKH